MKHFYVGINNFIYKHPFIKSCVHFSSLFCPWMVAIFYSLFLLKIVIESPNGFFYLFSKPMMVLICTALLRIFIKLALMKNIQLNLSVIKDKADILFQAFMPVSLSLLHLPLLKLDQIWDYYYLL